MAEKSFESMIKDLEDIVAEMEKGDISLEQAIELYDKGTKLALKCNKALDEAEQKITIVEKV